MRIVEAQNCCLNCSPSSAKAFHLELVNYFLLVKLASFAVTITIILWFVDYLAMW